jgi:superfamily II DNA or RNA helicase
MELRDYQNQIISDTRKSYGKYNRRIILQMHVGAGKTVVAAEIARSTVSQFKRVLFLVPRRQLAYQAVQTFTNYGINTGLIMAGEKPFGMPLLQVGSFDTITTRVKSGAMTLPAAEVVMVDEAHACFSKARLEFLSNYPLVIGITATPAMANGKGMGTFYTDIVEGLPMTDMVDQGYLVPMRYYGAEAPDLAKAKLNADGDYQEKDLAEASDKPELIGAIYDNYKRIAGDRTTLIFAVNCKHAQHIHDEFNRHGVSADYIDANTSTEEREEIKNRVMSGQVKVIVNIGVLAFGTDWPVISCVIIARVTRNISSWIQMIGRGSRLHPNKKDCLVIYHGDNFDELGRIDDAIEWSLDDKSTVRERKEAAKKEAKEPKDIKCKCGYVFRSSRICPACGLAMIQKGEAIPFHEADLKELVAVKKPTPAIKADWYAQLLYISRAKGYQDGWAANKFHDKFKEWPSKKHGVMPATPSEEVLGFMHHLRIKHAKAAA